MENVWTRINENIYKYMEKINEQYKFRYVKISPLKTALIGKEFILLIAIDRFDVNVSYISKIDGEIIVFLCDNYFAEKYNEEDRIGLLMGNDAEEMIINNLKVIDSGLSSKWRNVLIGEKEWLNDYRKSKWYAVGRLTEDEREIIKKYI